jgi:hypothetical protein
MDPVHAIRMQNFRTVWHKDMNSSSIIHFIARFPVLQQLSEQQKFVDVYTKLDMVWGSKG